MDLKSCLLLCEPIKFKNVCTIYPIDVGSYIQDDEHINELYVPYIISHDVINDELKDFSIFEIMMCDLKYRNIFIESLKLFCKTNNVKSSFDLVNENPAIKGIDIYKHKLIYKFLFKMSKKFREKYNIKPKDDVSDIEVYIDDNDEPLNKYNFDEFADIILMSGCKQKYKAEDVPKVPKFETPEGYERWKKYQERRKKNQNSLDTSIATVINIAQNGGSSYISEEIIKRWSMWKLISTYTSIMNKDNYSDCFQIYTQTGNKDLIKEHWSELLKVK